MSLFYTNNIEVSAPGIERELRALNKILGTVILSQLISLREGQNNTNSILQEIVKMNSQALTALQDAQASVVAGFAATSDAIADASKALTALASASTNDVVAAKDVLQVAEALTAIANSSKDQATAADVVFESVIAANTPPAPTQPPTEPPATPSA